MRYRDAVSQGQILWQPKFPNAFKNLKSSTRPLKIAILVDPFESTLVQFVCIAFLSAKKNVHIAINFFCQ